MTGLTSPLIHTWSLAVEEQFYLVWPLVFLGVCKFWRSLRALLIVAIAGALLSALEMALLYNPGDDNRLYFGTDTHAQSVLVGASLALRPRHVGRTSKEGCGTGLASPHALGPSRAHSHRRRRHCRQAPFCTARCRVDDAFAYSGGFLLAALAASAVLLSVSCAQFSPVARLLSFPVFTFAGRSLLRDVPVALPALHLHQPRTDGAQRVDLVRRSGHPNGGRGDAVLLLHGTAHSTRHVLHDIPGPSVRGPGCCCRRSCHRPGHHAGRPYRPGRGGRQGQLPGTPITANVPDAYRTTPTRVLLVGDSQALTLGIGLQAALTANPTKYDHMRLLNEGILGCGVAEGTTAIRSGGTFIVGLPCTPHPQSGKCPPGGVFGPQQNVPCQPWTTAWADWVRQFKPNVVVLLAGGGEVLDRVYRGHMTNILNPTFAAYVESQLEKAVRIATTGGADMVLMTKPCQSTGEQPNGDPWPQDSSARQEVYNSLLRKVAAEHPNQVYIQDLNSYVCPGGKYAEDLDGVPLREADGIHFDMQPGGGGDYLAPAILPYWTELGHLQEARTGGASVHVGALPRFFAPQ